MTLYNLLGKVEDDSNKELSWFLDFAEEYLDFTKSLKTIPISNFTINKI